MHPWRAPGTTRPRQLSHKSPREPEICSGKESEAMRATKNEEGRGVRAKACGVRAVGCSSIMCGQPVARVQRTKPRRKPVGDFYLPKTGRRGTHRTLGTFACTCSFPKLPCPTAHGYFSDGFLRWQRGRGSAPTSCSWTLGLRWRLPRWLASGTNGAELTVEGGEHGGIGSYRANSRGRSGAEGDGEEQEHVPRGEQLAGENAGRQQIAVTRRREREKSLYTYQRKQGQKPNVF